MKCVNSFLVISTLVGSGAIGEDILPKSCAEEQILELLTQWRNGSDLSPLPQLDEIRIGPVESSYDGFGIKVTFYTGDMQLIGVNNFVVEELAVSLKQLEASWTVRFPLLTLTSENYKLKGRAYLMYSLKGSGFMNATMENVVVTLGITLVSNGTATQADDVHFDFSADEILIDLKDSSWPINQVLNKHGLNIVEEHSSNIVSIVEEVLLKEVNEYLATTTTSQLSRIVNNYNCSYHNTNFEIL